ncbi:MAG: tRNA 2-thiouridine(34) synthase MnmA [Candidatus Kaiserbacteria bacterium]|nr:tRNA 2-thiouridine(34) synthase MnmA [Candidatus Kaiserbacteria bacterium]
MSSEKDRVGQRVGVLLSGGVDSSVAAQQLLQAGCVVSGVFITIRNPAHIPCTAMADRQDAMRACAALDIPFLEYDATAVYQEKVIEPFVEAYRQGETPNPDVLCNRFVKFAAAFSFVLGKGFSCVATGHYAQVREVDSMHRLYRSVDVEKDQTYFIYTIAQEVLNRVLFPVGGYTKQQVRAFARDAGLPAAEKKDSVGLCFLGDVSMQDFLSAYIEPKTGEVRLSAGGAVVGSHDGVWFYTPGQRHGFTITIGERGPYVVVGKDVAHNVLFVRPSDDVVDGSDRFTLKDAVFRRLPVDGEHLVARYRHRGALYPVLLELHDDFVVVVFTEKHVIAKGQSVVVYGHDEECLGGGVVSG